MTTAEDFDRWYADRVESPVADDLVHRMLALPPDLQSTSLLSGAGLDEVVAILDPRPGQLLLDLACGRGGYGLEIVRRTGCSLVGVDFSAVAIEQAAQRAVDLSIPPGRRSTPPTNGCHCGCGRWTWPGSCRKPGSSKSRSRRNRSGG